MQGTILILDFVQQKGVGFHADVIGTMFCNGLLCAKKVSCEWLVVFVGRLGHNVLYEMNSMCPWSLTQQSKIQQAFGFLT